MCEITGGNHAEGEKRPNAATHEAVSEQGSIFPGTAPLSITCPQQYSAHVPDSAAPPEL